MGPDEKRAWCQYASVQAGWWAARSFLRNVTCGDDEPQPPTAEQFELSATRCDWPTLKLYQPRPAVPARAPK